MDLQNAEVRYVMPLPWLRLGSGVWVGLGLRLQLELLMAFMWCGAKNSIGIGTILAVLFNSSIGIGIGNTFCQSIAIGTGNTFHKYC